MTDSAYLAQVQRQRDDAVRQLRAAERELGARRTCEALALAVLDGWGAAGAEADLMRREIRRALLLVGAEPVRQVQP